MRGEQWTGEVVFVEGVDCLTGDGSGLIWSGLGKLKGWAWYLVVFGFYFGF